METDFRWWNLGGEKTNNNTRGTKQHRKRKQVQLPEGYHTLTKMLETISTNKQVESTFKGLDMEELQKHKREALKNATGEAQQTK